MSKIKLLKRDENATGTLPLLDKPIVIKRYSNFQQVLVNGDDQVFVRELLKEHVPIEIQIKITQLFNQEFVRRQIVRTMLDNYQLYTINNIINLNQSK